MPARRRSYRGGGRGFRPATFWNGIVPAVTTQIPASSKVIVSSFSNVGDAELTIRRTRGLMQVQTDQDAASENQIGAMGVLVVNQTAATLGITGMPDPVTDVADDLWFVFEHIQQSFRFHSAVATEPHHATQYAFDSKAMRKVSQGEAIVMVVANAHATHAFNVSIGFRFLSSETGR